MQTKNYSEHSGISQSSLKDFRLKGPRKWKQIWIDKLFDTDKANEDNFTFGSLIDTILFSPELLKERYCISEMPRMPSKAIETIIKNVYDAISLQNASIISANSEEGAAPEPIPLIPYTLSYDETKKHILREANLITDEKDKDKKGWNKHWKDETRIAKIVEEGEEYMTCLVKAEGRKVIGLDMNMEALEMKKVLYTDSSVKKYFVKQENEELLFQLELFVQMKINDVELSLKGVPDIVHIDHNKKTIRLVDFKTSYSAYDFIKSVKQYDYVGQLSYYDFLLREWLKEYCDGDYCTYNILQPINIVVDIESKIPYIYEYDWRDIAMAKEGNERYLFDLYQTLDHNSRVKKGWMEILEEIAWHYKTNKWDKPKELYENGSIKINLLNS